MNNITLVPLTQDDRMQFILDNQEAFNYGALEEFGCRDDHFEEDGEIISRETIETAIDNGEAYRIVCGGVKVGGVIIKVDGDRVTARVSATPRGARLSVCIRRSGFGKLSLLISKNEISTFMSTAAVFISSSFSTAITPTRTIRTLHGKWTSSSRTGCSGLKNRWNDRVATAALFLFGASDCRRAASRPRTSPRGFGHSVCGRCGRSDDRI